MSPGPPASGREFGLDDVDPRRLESAWRTVVDRTPILLGRMSARIEQRPRPGERCVITAWATGHDGRKRSAAAAVHGEDGALLATSRATWIAVDREVQLGRAAMACEEG